MDRQREMKEKKEVQSSALRHRGKRTDTVGRRICVDEAKLAAMAISLNVRLRSADMSTTMQERALRFARSLVDSVTINGRSSTSSSLAHALKKEFDTSYGPAWHCVVGKSFGSFVTHSKGGFIYFSIDSLSFLLFKTEVHLVNEPPHPGSIPRDKPSTNN